jgi:hypothetical protein
MGRDHESGEGASTELKTRLLGLSLYQSRRSLLGDGGFFFADPACGLSEIRLLSVETITMFHDCYQLTCADRDG